MKRFNFPFMTVLWFEEGSKSLRLRNQLPSTSWMFRQGLWKHLHLLAGNEVSVDGPRLLSRNLGGGCGPATPSCEPRGTTSLAPGRRTVSLEVPCAPHPWRPTFCEGLYFITHGHLDRGGIVKEQLLCTKNEIIGYSWRIQMWRTQNYLWALVVLRKLLLNSLMKRWIFTFVTAKRTWGANKYNKKLK